MLMLHSYGTSPFFIGKSSIDGQLYRDRQVAILNFQTVSLNQSWIIYPPRIPKNLMVWNMILPIEIKLGILFFCIYWLYSIPNQYSMKFTY